MADELFVLPPHVLAEAALRARLKRRGHAGQPGKGPAGERCGTCRWLKAAVFAQRYSKCGHRMAPRPTHGPATDVKQKDPACERWEAPAHG